MIKYIFFDVGGVALFDFSKTNKWEQMIEKFKISKENIIDFNDFFKDFEKEICRGEKSLEDFLDEAKQRFQISIPKNYSMLNDFVDRFEINSSIHNIIEELSKTYTVGLLTNMYPGMLNKIKEKNLLPNVKWDTIVDSSKVGYKKPEKAIYQIAEEASGVKGSEILFIDNRKENLIMPRVLGWNTILYDPSDVEKSNKVIKNILATS